MKSIVSCSETCDADTVHRFIKHFAPAGIQAETIQTSYAMAEAVFAVTFSGLGKVVPACLPPSLFERSRSAFSLAKRHVLSSGSLLHGMQARIVDRDGNPVPEREIGEIVLKSDYMVETAQKLPGTEWTITGDLGFFDDQDLYIVGRTKDLIIVNGQNIFANQLERHLDSLEGVKGGRLAVLATANKNTGSEEILVLFERGEQVPLETIKQHVRKTVIAETGFSPRVAEVPTGFILKTTSGKIARSETLNKFLNRKTPQ